jgi:TrpR family transcriptional regulator, trp operon repressor
MKHKKYFDELISTLLNLKSKKEIQNFLEGILTPQELEQIPIRLQIVKMLKTGVAQREISQKLGVGIATVTRGAKELKNKHFKNIGAAQ